MIAEALTNPMKHAKAARVTVEIGYDGKALSLAVADDGIGSANEVGGSGLRGLRDHPSSGSGA